MNESTRPSTVTAVATIDAIRAGDTDPVAAVDEALERIEALNPALNAVIDVQADRARAAVAAGLPAGPLHGLPILLKDLGAQQAGENYHMGLQILKDAGWRAADDAHLVRRLKMAGAVVVGRTNTPELATSPTTEPVAYGAAHNPIAPGRTTGGSSGGSASAVAAGMVAIAHASDGGGSIRIPAACCGLFGLKPSRGRISRGPQSGEGWGGASTDGCVTHTVADTALFLDVVSGAEPGDPYNAPPFARPLSAEVGQDPGRLRIGVLDHPLAPGISPDADGRRIVDEAATILSDLGHEVTVSWPSALEDPAYGGHYSPLVCTAVSQALLTWSAALGRTVEPPELEPVNQLLATLGARETGASYLDHLSWLHAWTRRVAAFWAPIDDGGSGFDLLLSPTLGMAPPELGRLSDPSDPITAFGLVAQFIPFTSQWNVTGQPAVSLPIGTATDGTPMGFQLVAGPWREDRLVRVASQLEAAHPWR